MYSAHAVVRAKGDKAAPVGYLSDAVPHTKKNSFYAFDWSNTLSGERYLICVLRKSDSCICGRRGLCTFSSVTRAIAWSFNCLAVGKFPERDHLDRPFEDEVREARRGMDIAECWRGA